MPTEPRRATMTLHHRPMRSTSSDAGPTSEDHVHPSDRQSKGLRLLWKRRRTVTPAAFRSFVVTEQQSTISTNVTQRVDNDPNESIVFLNNSVEFDLRSYFFKKQKSCRTTDRLERSAISRSSVNSHRRHTNGYNSFDNSYKRELPIGTKSEVVDPSGALAAKQSKNPRRRLRAKEELCIVLPRSTIRGRTRSQKSWFLGPGSIGREPGEGTLVVTKDKSMDVVHAEISVAGDDYFLRDAQSTMGTFLCLSTRYRHYAQRDGFRLRHGDVFRIGPATSIRVLELQTSTEVASIQSLRRDTSRYNSSSSMTTMTPTPAASNAETNNSQAPELERTSSTRNGTPLERLSTVEELRLLAADIEDEFMNDDDRSHLKSTPRSEANTDTETPQPSTPTRSKLRHNVHFSDTPPLMSDGSVFLGSRYIRPDVRELHYHEPSQVEDADDDMIKQLVGSEHDVSPTDYSNSSNIKARRPASIQLVIFQHDPIKASIEPPKPRDAREVTLSGQTTYLIGSSAACDVRIFPSEGIEVRAVHARISFDGSSFVLEDVSFESDPRRQTRVLLTQRPVRVTRGDWLLLGKCALYITTVPRAFGLDRRPDMKEAAMRLDVLRLSKRKPRTRSLFVPVGFRLHSSSGTGASSGSSGWGGSSGGPVTFGKGRDCDAQVFTASLATEQFSVQLERGTCWLTPKPTGINAGTYFLIGRDEVGPPFVEPAAGDTQGSEESKEVEIVKHTSKPLLLSEGCVFRCGGCELEVIFSKSTNAPDLKSTAALEEQEHIQVLCAISWLQPIATDVKTVANVARCGQRLKLGAGDLIYEKGDAANIVFIVISGEVSLHIATLNDEHDRDDGMVEQIGAGGFFGEISLHDPFETCASAPYRDDLEQLETAKAASTCELLALAREDVCGYLEPYMDIIRAHLRHDRCRDRIIRIACSYVSWLRDIPLQEMRTLSSHAEVAVYPAGSVLFEDGKLFVPAAFAGGNTFQLRDGLLVLRRGNVQVVRSKHERHHRRSRRMYHEEDLENEQRALEDVGDEVDEEPDEWWSPKEPVVAMSSSSSPSVLSFCDLSFRLEANSTVECYFVAAVHLEHFYAGGVTKQQQTFHDQGGTVQTRPPLKRGNSQVGRRMHHSQVVTSALHNENINGDDDDHNALDGSDGEGDTTAAHRWRRKKRNKRLLEQTVQQVKNDVQIPNTLVLYVLAGAQRGDIHVVRNVASIGGLLSGADIELNDRYVSPTHAIIEYHDGRYWLYDSGSKWGTFVRLEEDNAVDINPGDVFLSGEVEFTCLASYPERNKPSMCMTYFSLFDSLTRRYGGSNQHMSQHSRLSEFLTRPNIDTNRATQYLKPTDHW